MKRKYLVLLVFFFIFGNNWLFAQSIGIRVPDTTVVAGTFVDIPIYADNSLTGYDITAYTLQLSFDENYFQAVSVIVTGTISAPFGIPLYNTSVHGRITIASAGSSPLIGAGKLLYIRLKALKTGQIWINFSGSQYNFFNEGLPEMSLTNGYVNILSPSYITISPDYGEITKGEELQLYINGGKAPFTWFVNDTTCAFVDNNGILKGLKSGLVRVIAVDSEGLRDTSGFIEIKPFRLSIPSDLSQWQGSYIDVPIFTTDLGSEDLISGNITLGFNQSILTPVGIIQEGTLMDNFPLPEININTPGVFNLAFAGTTNLSGAGTLIFVRFLVSNLNSGSSELHFLKGHFNENIVPSFTDGQIFVKQLPQLNILPKSGNVLAGEKVQLTVVGDVNPPIIWQLNNTISATIDSAGLLTALQSGVVMVEATDSLGSKAFSESFQIFDSQINMPDIITCPDTSDLYYPVFIESKKKIDNLISFQGTINFDKNYLTFLDIETTGTLTQGWLIEKNISEGQIRFAGSANTPVDENGAFFKLKFEKNPNFKSGDRTSVYLNSLTLNEGYPLALLHQNGNVSMESLGAIGSIYGSSVVCQGQNEVYYSVPPINNATEYIWNIPEGARIISGDKTNSVVINYSDSAKSGVINVSGKNECTTGTVSPDFLVYINPLPKVASSISGDSVVVKNQKNLNYSIAPIEHANYYIWTLPIGFVGESTTNNILVSINEKAESGLIKVKGINNCGEGTECSLFIKTSALAKQTFVFKKGWNIFSSPLVPDDLKMEVVFQSLTENKSLIKVQDESGNSLEDWGIFGGWQNNIGNISPTEGYKIKMSITDSLEIRGTPVEYPFAIPLKTGWNIAGYPRQSAISGMNLVQQLIERGTLVKVQDEKGNAIEDWGIFGGWQNNIGDFMAGEGYKIKVSGIDTLWIYESYPKSRTLSNEKVATTHFQRGFAGNGVDHMNINLVGLPNNFLQAGDELAVFEGATCVGAVTLLPHHLSSQTISIAASATDKQGMAGFTEGNPFILKLWNSKQNQEFVLEPEIIKGTSTFTKHETTVASLEKYATTGLDGIPGSYLNEIKIYPNPTTGIINIEFTGAGRNTEVSVSNLVGAEIFRKEITDAATFQIDLSNQVSGLYLLKIISNNRQYISKIVVSRQK